MVHNTLENGYKDKRCIQIRFFCYIYVFNQDWEIIYMYSTSDWEIIFDQIACQALAFHGLDS